MKRLSALVALLGVLCGVLVSCDDNMSSVGSSLVEDRVQVVVDSSFVLEGASVERTRLQSRTVTQLLGTITADGYGEFSSNVVTQFMPGLALDTKTVKRENIDSIKLIMRSKLGAYVGDSIMPMGVEVFPLKRQLTSPIYSDFDPAGYYDPTPWGSAVYTASAVGQNDSIRKLGYRTIEVNLPIDFARSIYDEYVNSPASFQNPGAFAEFFPGLYIATSFGSGRVTRIDNSFITLYYHTTGTDAETGKEIVTKASNTFLAVTPEVISNNDIDYEMAPALSQRVSAGETLLVAPLGYEVQLKMPARAIVESYRSKAGPISLINALSMTIPAEKIANSYGILPPANILMVKKSMADEFFAKNMIADGISSFTATYSATAGCYSFSNLRHYALDLVNKEGALTADDEEFVIVPVTVVSETVSSTTVITSMTPYITTPAMCRLRLDKAKIKLTFSKQDVEL